MKRVMYLNDLGNLQQNTSYEYVAKESRGVDPRYVMKLLQDVEDKKDKVANTTAFVVSALRARRTALLKRLNWLNKYGNLKKNIWYDRVMDTIEQHSSDMGFVLQISKQEHAVRKRISWFNTKGKLEEKIRYQDLAEATTPLDMEALLQALDEFEEARKQTGPGQDLGPTEAVLRALQAIKDAKPRAHA